MQDTKQFTDTINSVKELLKDLDVDGSISTKLTTIIDDYTSMSTQNESLTQENETYKSNNEKLRETNMQLFLRVGEKKKPDPEDKPKPEEKKLEYADLFDEKGLLK